MIISDGTVSFYLTVFEFILLGITLSQRKKHPSILIAALMIFFLAGYQLCETLMCRFCLTGHLIPYLALVDISFLPPLSLVFAYRFWEVKSNVPYLFFSSDCNSDFEKHCNNMFTQSLKRDLTGLDKYRKDHGEWDLNLPSSVRNFLYRGADKDYFTQFVVCSMDNFPDLIRKIKQVTTKTLRKISDHRIF